MLDILGKVNSESFVIMDELGSGTDPAEGMGIATAILEELRKSGANFLVTTHYPEIKDYAAKHENIINKRPEKLGFYRRLYPVQSAVNAFRSHIPPPLRQKPPLRVSPGLLICSPVLPV